MQKDYPPESDVQFLVEEKVVEKDFERV